MRASPADAQDERERSAAENRRRRSDRHVDAVTARDEAHYPDSEPRHAKDDDGQPEQRVARHASLR
jgi:hypothetical protein